MKHKSLSIKFAGFVVVGLCTVLPGMVSADEFFNGRRLITFLTYFENGEYGDTLVRFGGCENNTCSEQADDDYHNRMWVIGDLDVLQGAYYLTEADNYAHGRLKLKYDYKLTSEEKDDDSGDFGRIRLKDTDTDEIIYEKVLVPENAGDWKTEIISLPGENATKNLQLVFESNNDDSGLTQLYIRNWRMEHKSEPAIIGTITYKVDGETRYAAHALVALQNKARTNTYAYTSTNERGEYTFFPVAGNQRYTVTATLGNYNGLKRIHRKVKYGEKYDADLKLNNI